MKKSERRLLWQSCIQAFQTNGESSVAANNLYKLNLIFTEVNQVYICSYTAV